MSQDRSQSSPRTGKIPKGIKIILNRAVFSSHFGSVRVYTRRHINGCSFTQPDQQNCPCPKWIYAKARDGKPSRRAATTPSFTEACEQAQKILKGFDPEIRAAREVVAPAGITVETAIEHYLAKLGARPELNVRYRGMVERVFRRRASLVIKNRPGRTPDLSLLEFLDRASLTAVDPILRMDQLSGEIIEDWAAGWRSNDSTSRVRRSIAAGFFNWAMRRGHLRVKPQFERRRVKSGNRCGVFTEEQFQRLLAALPFYFSGRGPKMSDNLVPRLRAFLEAGRWGGMAVCDIVLFSPAMNLNPADVLTYRRKKTGEIAQVALPAEVAARLRAIPSEPGSGAGQPFRFAELNEEVNRELWRERFQRLCRKAGITEIETEHGARRKPHPHMLRDTCAVDAITHGVLIENVAKMLGHATTAMTERAYTFWVKKRLDYCIEDQRRALARRVEIAAAAAAESPQANAGALRRTLVH